MPVNEELSRAIRSFTFYWAGDNDIKRPATFPEHSRVVGIQSSYQYFFRRAGEVLVRKAPCWCQSCTKTSLAGPVALHGEDYSVIKCHRRINDTYYEYKSRCCKVLDGPGTGEPHKRAIAHGHELAPKANAGDWILVEAWDDDEQEVWLAKTVAHFGRNCQRKTTARQKNRFPTKGVRFTKGEYAIAVQYYGRVDAPLTSPSRRGEQHFELEEDQPTDGIPMIVNSTELRSIVPAADLEEVSDGIWRLSRTAEEEALSWCR